MALHILLLLTAILRPPTPMDTTATRPLLTPLPINTPAPLPTAALSSMIPLFQALFNSLAAQPPQPTMVLFPQFLLTHGLLDHLTGLVAV